jgi:hypothetical protein
LAKGGRPPAPPPPLSRKEGDMLGERRAPPCPPAPPTCLAKGGRQSWRQECNTESHEAELPMQRYAATDNARRYGRGARPTPPCPCAASRRPEAGGDVAVDRQPLCRRKARPQRRPQHPTATSGRNAGARPQRLPCAPSLESALRVVLAKSGAGAHHG